MVFSYYQYKQKVNVLDGIDSNNDLIIFRYMTFLVLITSLKNYILINCLLNDKNKPKFSQKSLVQGPGVRKNILEIE